MSSRLPGFCADLEILVEALRNSIPANVYGLLHDGSPQECIDCYRKIMAAAYNLKQLVNDNIYINAGLILGPNVDALNKIRIGCDTILKNTAVFNLDLPAFIAGAPAEDADENLVFLAKESISLLTKIFVLHFHANAKKASRLLKTLQFVQHKDGFRLEPVGESIPLPKFSCDGNCVCGGNPIGYWCGGASDVRSGLAAVTANPSTDACAQRVREVLTMILN